MTTASLPLPPDEYKQVVESFAQAVWETDAAGQVVADSPSWRAYTGQSLDEWLGEGWVGAIHPDDQAYALHQWQEAVRQHTVVNAEYRLRSPDGGWRWTNVRAVRIRDADGAVNKWVGLNIDIDDRKKAEHALQQYQAHLEEAVSQRTAELQASQELLQATLDSTLELIQVFEAVRDDQGQIIDFVWRLNNRAAEHYYGDVVGQRLLMHNPGVKATGIFDTFKQVVETGNPDQSERHYVHEQFNGWFYQSTVKLNDGVATTTTDISQLKKAETQIRSGHALLQSVIDSSLDIIQVFKAVRDDTDQLIDFVWVINNRKAIDQNGTVIGESLLKNSPGVIPSGVFEHMVEVAQTGVAYEHEQYYAHEQFADWFYQAIVKTDDGVAMTTRNITQQKQAEQQILRLKDEKARQVTDKYQALFNSIDQGFCLVDLIDDERGQVIDYRFLEVNPVFEQQTGLVGSAGKTVMEIAPLTESYWLDRYETVARTGQSVRFENYTEHNQSWYTVFATRVGRADSRRVAIVFDDITSRKNQEERQAYLLKLSDALRPLSDSVDIQDTAARTLGEHLHTDHAYYVSVDESAGAFIGARDGYSSGFASQFRRYLLNDWLLSWLTEGKTWVMRDTITDQIMPDGQRESYLTNDIGAIVVVPLIKESKLVATFVASQRVLRHWTPTEISLIEETAERTWAAVEWATTEEALRRLEERTRLAIEAAELATWEWDLTTDQVYWNEQHFHMLGMAVQPGPLPAEAFLHHIHPDDADSIREQLRVAIQQRTLYDAELRVIRDDGIVRWMHDHGRVVAEQNQQPTRASGVMIDITERKKAEQELKESDRRKDEFLAMLAHELRNPMAVIRNGLSVMELTTTDELTRSTVVMMNRQTDHLVRMVDELLDVSRISRGKIELKRERVNLVELMQQAAKSIQPLFSQQGKTLHIDLPTAPVELLGDATRLTQVVTNLLTNGLRYTEDEGTVWLQLRLQSDPEGRMQAMIQVRDNGIGLAPNQLSAIFELFVQVDNSLARSKGGLGLGLTLVRQLIDMHGGRVTAQSDGLGQGSTFTVQLPTLAAIEVTNTTHIPDTSATVETLRILVIDDNPDAAMTLGMLLTLKGYETHTRTSGQAGLEAAEQLRPGVILLDIGMPGLDGYETCRLIREQPWGQRIIVIALTGYGQEEDRQRTRDAGFDDHLVKPVDLETLINVLAAHR